MNDVLFESESLKRAHRIAAQIVMQFGDKYIPVFQRLHTEIEKMHTVQASKGLALKVATEMSR